MGTGDHRPPSRRKFIGLFGTGVAAVATVKIAPAAALPVVPPVVEAAPIEYAGPIFGEARHVFHALTSGGSVSHSNAFSPLVADARLEIFDGEKFVPFESEEGAAVHNKLIRLYARRDDRTRARRCDGTCIQTSLIEF